ncbi:XRE family transcriptional regulator [Deinococcus sp. ME38]|uniref:XRE family transcriptional regulator n=1 Tax=Deinococcus sp. ME38 TaxID=3400344 RepID=UPI003B5A4210
MSGTEEMIEAALRTRLAELGMTNADLARRLAVQPPHVSRVVGRQSGRIPQSLIDVLDELGLELAVVKKD